MDLTWYGHSSWHVSVGGTDLMIDPFFQNPFTDTDPTSLATPEYLLCSHGHADHIADVAAFSDATAIATPELAQYLEDEHDVAETIMMNIGGTVEAGDAYITMHRADHTNGLETDYQYSAGPPTGFIISDTKPTQVSDVDSTTFYHAGDTGLMTEMREVIGPYLEPDAAAVPIGDHFTMGPYQAAIAVDWLDVDVAFPMHYNTFPPIEVDPSDFTKEVRAAGSDAEVAILDGDETYTI